MNQHISEERLTAFIDNQMSEPESKLIRAHLKVCDECAAYVDEIRSLFIDLSELESAPDEPELLNDTMRLWQMMNQQTQSSGNRFRLQGLKNSYKFIATGAVAAGLAIGILFGNFASLGLMPDDSDTQFSSVVLQENGQTINSTYLAMIINDGQDDL